MTAGPNQPSDATPSYNSPAGAGYVQTALAIMSGTVVKASPGAVIKASVTVAGSGAGAIYDCASTAAASATANEVAVLPATVGIYDIQFPCAVGITVLPGSGQT